MLNDLWNTFDGVRAHLLDQYRHPRYAPGSGLSAEELKPELEKLAGESAALPRIRTRALVLARILEKARIGIDPCDWFADHLDAGDYPVLLREQWREEARRAMPEVEAECRRNIECGLSLSQLDLSHTAPDWHRVLHEGPAGIRDRALAALAKAGDEEAKAFFAAVACVYGAMVRYLERLAEEAERCGAARVIAVLRHLTRRPPESFQEALQLALIYHHVQEWEGELVRSMGCFDRLFLPYYRADLAAGRLTRVQAKELLKFYWTKYLAQSDGKLWGKNFCFGGMTSTGDDASNELTELALEVYQELQVVDPKLTLRVHRKLPQGVLLQATECLRQGKTAIVFANDEVARTMFLRRGKTPEEIDDFVAIGCYEPCIMGKELCCSMSTLFNYAKVVELLLQQESVPGSFEELCGRYLELMRIELSKAMALTRCWEQCWPQINPSPVLSGTMDSCFEKGRDVSHAGTKYSSSGVMCAGIGTAVDSLIAMKRLLFDECRCSWQELRRLLAADWKPDENLRLYAVSQLPKWGNNLPEVDGVARQIADAAAALVNHTPNARGGFFQLGMWSIDWNVMFGAKTGATPDGRFSGAPLNKNLGAAIAQDKRGIAALIHSAMVFDHAEFPDGSVLDVMLHPSMVAGADGARVIADLVRTYFAGGGLFIQFNLLDVEALRKARKEPEKYSSIQIRVCGWNVRFIDLAPEAQELFIREAEAKSC